MNVPRKRNTFDYARVVSLTLRFGTRQNPSFPLEKCHSSGRFVFLLVVGILLPHPAQAHDECQARIRARKDLEKEYQMVRKDLIKRHEWAMEAEKTLDEYYPHHYSEMDESGNVTHYIGKTNEQGEVVWKQSDQAPNGKGSSGKNRSSDRWLERVDKLDRQVQGFRQELDETECSKITYSYGASGTSGQFFIHKFGVAQPATSSESKGALPTGRELSDEQKLAATMLRAIPGIDGAIERFNQRSSETPELPQSEIKPEGFSSIDVADDEWVFDSKDDSNPRDTRSEAIVTSARELRQKAFDGLLKDQGLVKPGEDGYMTRVNPLNRQSAQNESSQKTYFQNGFGNSYPEARNSTQLVANEWGEDVINVYSEGAKQTDQSFPVMRDANDAILYAKGMQTTATHVLTQNIYEDLMAGEEVLVFAHSRGAAVMYNVVPEVQEKLDFHGKGYLLQNLQVVTLGGYSPPAEMWGTSATIVDIANEGDLIPALRGHGHPQTNIFNSNLREAHPVRSYLPWIRYIQEHGIDDIVRNQSLTPSLPPEIWER